MNLKSLCLSGCKNLVELSDLSLASKLEKVHLDDCASLLNVPSYILSLDSLLALNLRGCKQLCYIESEKQSISLRWLTLSGCSRLVRYSVFSDELNYLNLDFTAIEELPHNLDLLPKLKKLSLRGSNIEILPASIKHLSLLRALDVSNCRRLRSIPKLPLLLQDLNASNCISLETVSNSGITMLQDSFGKLNKRTLLTQIHREEQMSIRRRDYLGRFEFHNCIKLDQIARMTVTEEALIRIQLAADLSSKTQVLYDPYCQADDKVSKNFDHEDFLYVSRPFYSILLGNKVPDWFLHKETNSLFITIEFSEAWSLLCRCRGFAFCLVLGASEPNKKNIRRTGLIAGCRYNFGGEYKGTSIMKSSYSDAKSDQVWLWYDQILEVADFPGTLPWKVYFEFFVRPGCSGSIVKQCGIQPLYAPFDIKQNSNEEVNREGKMPYHELEYRKDPRKYWLLRHYAHPPDGLGFPSKQQRISGCHDGHIMEPIPSTYCAENVDGIVMEHNHAEVCVNFGLIRSGYHHPRDLQCLAQMLLDDYCNFGKLVDNIDIFSSLRRLSICDCNVESFPSRIANLSSLEYLSIRNCKNLRSLSKLPPSLQYLSVFGCTSLKTVEFAEEYVMVVDVIFGYEKITRVIEVEKVLRIQVTDPRANVRDWTMQKFVYSMFITFYVASILGSLNVERRDCCTIEVTVNALV